MKFVKRHPILTGIALFLFCVVGLNILFGPATCRDGWRSSSIGRQGACSHHGGVDRSKGSIAFFIAVVVGGGVGYSLYQKAEAEEREVRRVEHERHKAAQAERENKLKREFVETGGKQGGPACPICGSLMLARTARKGKRRGSQFWGCSRYPACRGTRSRS